MSEREASFAFQNWKGGRDSLISNTLTSSSLPPSPRPPSRRSTCLTRGRSSTLSLSGGVASGNMPIPRIGSPTGAFRAPLPPSHLDHLSRIPPSPTSLLCPPFLLHPLPQPFLSLYLLPLPSSSFLFPLPPSPSLFLLPPSLFLPSLVPPLPTADQRTLDPKS